MTEKTQYTIDLEPIGRRSKSGPEQSILAIAQRAGVEIVAVCGGAGSCGKCGIRLIKGNLSEPTAAERRFYSDSEIQSGFRLACQAFPRSDVKIDIPPESLSTPQRLQIEGQETEVAPDPVVKPLTLSLVPPGIHDLRSDTLRLTDAMSDVNVPRPFFSQPVLRNLSHQLRTQDWTVKLAIREQMPRSNPSTNCAGGEVVGILQPDQAMVGLAVDIGTTKIAAYLVELSTGRTLAKAGLMNPQIAYGEDVVSRIAYANENPDGRHILQIRLITGMNNLIQELCDQVHVSPEQIVDAVVVGNTAIHHLFTGLPVEQLGASPYIASVSEALDIPAEHLGLHLAPGARVYLPPNIAGYVGADHISMLLATDVWRAKKPTVALDIGTNTEISLAINDQVLSCSCASGPAFEGAHIYAGMRAAPGAVEYVQIEGDDVRIQTIGGKPAVGICGSGILDAVSQLYKAGIIGRTGRMVKDHARVIPFNGGGAFVLIPEKETGNGHDLLVTRNDVNEIQLAKGAIRAGVEVLLHEAGIGHEDIDAFVVAGAFGTYLDLRSATLLGMFPRIPLDRFHQVGNAAGTGARHMLISAAHRRIAESIIDRTHYVELTAHPSFTDIYMDAMILGA
ncbi:MAG: ASKHA domain-containing protein [Anaerolineae bacterium]|nr:ASKHA domain-containing protein [Anaerolineae bacterium]